MNATVRLYKPADLFGKVICWRLSSDYCHATIQFGEGVIYSATFPHILALPIDNKDVAIPPRSGSSYEIRLTDAESAKAETWCRSMVGTNYDVVSMLGWLFHIQAMQRPHDVYCFELVFDAFAAAGVFAESKRLVTGDQLLDDLFVANRVVMPVSDIAAVHGKFMRATLTQRKAVTVKAPQVKQK